MSGWVALAVSLLLLAANACFVAAEFALLAVRRSRVDQLAAEGDRRALAAQAGLKELSLTLAGAQLGITLASFGIGAVAEPAVGHAIEALLGRALPEEAATVVGFLVALSLVVFLHMVVGEMAPKSWAIADPERSALLLARPFRAFVRLLRWAIALLNALANALVRAVGVTPVSDVAVAHSPDELLLILRESARAGGLTSGEQALLQRSLELSGLDAEQVMVPRRDVVSIPDSADAEEIAAVAARTGRSRLLVRGRDLDEVVGVLHVKDLLLLDDRRATTVTAGDLARPALFIPESRSIEDLLLDMRDQGQHLAVVVDEYGSTAGLVALEDVLEELIGDFDDETDRITRRLQRRPDGRVVVAGQTRPHELAEETGIVLPDGPYQTVAGFVMHTLGAMPRPGSAVVWKGLELTVTGMDGYRVTDVTIRPVTAGSAGPTLDAQQLP